MEGQPKSKWGAEPGKDGIIAANFQQVPKQQCFLTEKAKLPNFRLSMLKSIPKPQIGELTQEEIRTFALKQAAEIAKTLGKFW